MTIRKGEEWGRPDITPASFFIAEDDRDAASQPPLTPFALCRGDMFTSLGQPRLPKHHTNCTIVPIDAVKCSVSLLDGNEEIIRAFSNVSIGSWWRRRHIVITNSGFAGGLNIAPRSHPNDGEVDIVTLANDMPLKQRFIARRKAKTGTHLPHPQLTMRRATMATFFRERPQERLAIDGVAVAQWTSISIEVEPDYWQIIL